MRTNFHENVLLKIGASLGFFGFGLDFFLRINSRGASAHSVRSALLEVMPSRMTLISAIMACLGESSRIFSGVLGRSSSDVGWISDGFRVDSW